MKRTLGTLGSMAMAIGMALAAPANAAAIVDVVDGGPTDIRVGQPFSFVHQLEGYNAGSGSIAAADLVIVLTDDNGNEDYTISFGTAPQVGHFTANISGNTPFGFALQAQSLADLSADGWLHVTIAATDCNGSQCGSYALRFVSSTLTAQVGQPSTDQAATAVAEPGTLALVGLGLAGVATLRRRRPNPNRSRA